MRRFDSGFTWVEVLIGVFVGFVLIALGVLTFADPVPSLQKNRMNAALTNARQFQIAIQSMTEDNMKLGRSLQWTCSNGVPQTFEQLTNELYGRYLTENDMKKMLSGPETGAIFKARDPRILNFFAVTLSDPSDTLLLATTNWPGMGSTNLSGNLFDGQGFVVIRKNGEGNILKPHSFNDTNAIGAGGQFNYLPLK